VTLIAISFALFNWGLGLIVGALFARKVAEHAEKNLIPINFPLIGACGYAGLMVWHGGLSGSAPLKVAQQGHMFANLTNGQGISISETLLSPMNLTAILICLVCLPLAMALLARYTSTTVPSLPKRKTTESESGKSQNLADKLDIKPFFAKLFGALLLFGFLYVFWIEPGKIDISKIDPNLINLFFLALALLLHWNIRSFIAATEEAIVGSTGIMLQFPLYAGIMGIMTGSGLITVFSKVMVNISGAESFFILTLASASIVNFFVPSGGGQWAVQGEIVLSAANSLNVSQPKAVMALAYGDQLTNMMQPFWALPLLAITGLKAVQIMPYTLFLMLIGSLIFSSVLLVF
jgi:short-chain fatty acids transporter